MQHIPLYIPAVFVLTVVLALLLFYKAAGYSKRFLVIVGISVLLQSVLAISGFYQNAGTTPPRFAAVLLPPLVMMMSLFLSKGGRSFLNNLRPATLTIFHVVRIPVELILYWLAMHGAVPRLMTFEGQNFDLLSGLSAPLVYYLVFVRKSRGNGTLVAWNVICLALVLNVAITGILAAPMPIQQIAFATPNVAVMYFPYVLLPALLVPLVVLSHLAALRQSYFLFVEKLH